MVRNHLMRESGRQDRVIVQCAECKEFVACYAIASGGYYHHRKGFESYLRGLTRAGETISGKDIQESFESIQQECLDFFERVLEYLKEHKKEE